MSEPPPHDALLVLALECERVLSGSERWSLDATDQVALGRGDVRAARRDKRTLSVSVPDQRMSTEHARLIRIGERWLIEDRGSKNGTVVNGQPLLRAELGDGDLLELGRTLFVFRELERAGEPIADMTARALERKKRAFRTLSPAFEASLAELAKSSEQPRAVVLIAERGSGVEAIVRTFAEQAKRAGGVPIEHFELSTATPQQRAKIAEIARSGERVVVVSSDHPPSADELGPALAGARTLGLPPLRMRREDLGFLIGAALRAADGLYEWAIEPDAARALFRHAWPDNARELDETLRAAAARSDDGLLRLEHLPEGLRVAPPPPAEPELPESEPPPGNGLRDELCAILVEHGGNVSRAARALGRDRSSFRRQLARLAIEPAAFRRAMEKKKPSDVR